MYLLCVKYNAGNRENSNLLSCCLLEYTLSNLYFNRSFLLDKLIIIVFTYINDCIKQ